MSNVHPILGKASLTQDATNRAVRTFLQGLANGWTTIDVLRRAGRNPTPASVARAVATLVEAGNPFLLSGVKVRGTQTTAQLQLARWRAGRWLPFGGVLTLAR